MDSPSAARREYGAVAVGLMARVLLLVALVALVARSH
jgi:hypothetical protein